MTKFDLTNVWDAFGQERDCFLPGLEKQPHFDAAGISITFTEFSRKLLAVWALFPAIERVDVRPIATQVAEDEGTVSAAITWHVAGEQRQLESSFRLQPSPYTGWDVVQTSLLDDLLALDA